MKGSAWHIPDDGAASTDALSSATTVSLAFVRSTIRRLWFLWLAFTLAGTLIAAGWLVAVPARSVGTVTLLLAHDPGSDPQTAMATDVSLLRTRTVARELIDRLSLDTSPEDLQASIFAQPTTSSVLQVEIEGSNPDDAVARARLLSDIYLDFRQEQLLLQADAVIDGHRQRIQSLQAQVDQLTAQYDAVTAQGDDSGQGAEIIGLRAQLLNRMTSLENAIEDAALEVSAIVAASRVLDPASLVPQSPSRRAVLAVGSGIVGGLGLGLGLVLVYALTTGRLRSRADVAAALGLPVVFSARSVVPRRGRLGADQVAGLDLLVEGLATALPDGEDRPRRLGLVSVDCAREGALVVAALAQRLGHQGSVVVLDVAGTGAVEEELARLSFADGADRSSAVMVVSDPHADAVADVKLVVAPFEIGRGLAHVASAAPRCVLLVKAGRSTPEGLRTVAQAARAAGIDVPFVMLLGTDTSDHSFGAAVDDIPALRERLG